MDEKKNKINKKGLIILAFFLVLLGIITSRDNGNTEDITETAQDPEPIRPTINSWLLYGKWFFEEKRTSGDTEEIPVPKDAIACKIVVFWEGTNPIGKGYGDLIIYAEKIIDAGEYNDIIRIERFQVDKSFLNEPDSIELIVYVEEDALYYYFTFLKANIGNCIIEIYTGY